MKVCFGVFRHTDAFFSKFPNVLSATLQLSDRGVFWPSKKELSQRQCFDLEASPGTPCPIVVIGVRLMDVLELEQAENVLNGNLCKAAVC